MNLRRHDIEAISISGTILEMQVDGKSGQFDLIQYSYRLGTCTAEQRERVEIIADGAGLFWPDLDEILPVDLLLKGSCMGMDRDVMDALVEKLREKQKVESPPSHKATVDKSKDKMEDKGT